MSQCSHHRRLERKAEKVFKALKSGLVLTDSREEVLGFWINNINATLVPSERVIPKHFAFILKHLQQRRLVRFERKNICVNGSKFTFYTISLVRTESPPCQPQNDQHC